MTELAMSDGNPPARVSLLTLVSFRGVGIFWETPGQFRVSSRQTGSNGAVTFTEIVSARARARIEGRTERSWRKTRIIVCPTWLDARVNERIRGWPNR
jgi:hypothetical protein